MANNPHNLDPSDGSLDQIADYMVNNFNRTLAVESSDTIIINISALLDHEKDYAIDATQLWANLIGLEVEITNNDNAHITFTNNISENSDASTHYQRHNESNLVVARIDINPTEPDHPFNIWATYAYLHEIGHALGLDHPGPYPDVDENGNYIEPETLKIFPNDNDQVSIMSYIPFKDNDEYWSGTIPMTPMIADIIAIQSRFNKKGIFNHDNTTYGVGSDAGDYLNTLFDYFTNPYTVATSLIHGITIYDTGGYDTIDFSNHTLENPNFIVRITEDNEVITDYGIEGQRVNLNPGHSSDVYNSLGNLVIARDTIIERFFAGAGDDHITGNTANNWLEGRDGDDTLLGGPGNDLLIGGPGGDTLNGGPDNDTASYHDSNERVDVRLSGTYVRYGYAEGDTLIDIENLRGSDFNDILTGNNQSNGLSGGPGNDLLWGSSGNDYLKGGEGADRLVGGSGNDTAIYSGSNTGVVIELHNYTANGGHAEGDTFPYSIDITWTDNKGNEQTKSLPDIENLTGSSHDDTLTGDRRDNVLAGAAGNDTLEGLAGADTLIGGIGIDTATYATSPAGVTVRLHNSTTSNGHAEGDIFRNDVNVTWTDDNGTIHNDFLPDIENLTGSQHDDILTGDRRDNILSGNAGNDRLYGGPGGGDDMLNGGPGDDKIYGGQGKDTLIGGPGNDTLFGGSGIDTASYTSSPAGVTIRLHNMAAKGGDANGDIFKHIDIPWTDDNGTVHNDSLPDIENLIGSPHNDILAGDRRDNILTGNDGDDKLYGGPGGGDDVLNGGPGDDRIYGGQGRDTLIGGPGNDTLTGGEDADIFIFSPGDDNDTIRKFDPTDDQIDLTAFNLPEDYTLQLTTVNDSTLLNLANVDGGEIVFEGLIFDTSEISFII